MGLSIDTFDLRTIVKSYLDTKGTNIKKFKDNMPGIDFAMCFLRRHRDTLSQRLCQNIKRSRTTIEHYTKNKSVWAPSEWGTCNSKCSNKSWTN